MKNQSSNYQTVFGQLKLMCIAVLCLFFASSAAFAQYSSKAFLVVDSRTGKILEANNIDEKLPVASLTKVVTASVVLDWVQVSNKNLNEMITVPAEALSQGGANPLGFQTGDRLSIRDALSCSLMASDNVSAYALANHIGTEMWRKDGRRAKSAVDYFVGQMNALTSQRGMDRSRFYNPHGLDNTKSKGYSTARDMVKIASYAMKKPSFTFVVRQKQRDIAYTRGAQKLAFRIFNTNELLGQHAVDGLKTGRTTRAGSCFLFSSHRKDKITEMEGNRYLRVPYHVIGVTLNSSNRFGQAIQLINSGFSHYDSWVNNNPTMGSKDRVILDPFDLPTSR